MKHFAEVFTQTKAGALAASIFHFGEIPIPQLKAYLKTQQIPIRWILILKNRAVSSRHRSRRSQCKYSCSDTWTVKRSVKPLPKARLLSSAAANNDYGLKAKNRDIFFCWWNTDRLRQRHHLGESFPTGPTCHTGSCSCFGNKLPKGFLYELENVIEQRIADKPENSYTSKLFSRGVNKRLPKKVVKRRWNLLLKPKTIILSFSKSEAADL